MICAMTMFNVVIVFTAIVKIVCIMFKYLNFVIIAKCKMVAVAVKPLVRDRGVNMSKLYTGDLECIVTFRCSNHLKNGLSAQASLLDMDLSTYIRALLSRCLYNWNDTFHVLEKETQNEHE